MYVWIVLGELYNETKILAVFDNLLQAEKEMRVLKTTVYFNEWTIGIEKFAVQSDSKS